MAITSVWLSLHLCVQLAAKWFENVKRSPARGSAPLRARIVFVGSNFIHTVVTYLLAYSPLHNLRPGTAYPPTLIVTPSASSVRIRAVSSAARL